MNGLRLWYYNDMNKKDLVSVIIPVYNRCEMIHRALQSVLNQSYDYLEIIISDDGSTDYTVQSLEIYSDNPSVHIQKLEHSGHPGLVRNRAAELAQGKWLAFLDSDDIWMEDKISKQMDYLETHREYQFIHTLERWERNGSIISQSHRKHNKEGDLFTVSLGKCEIGPSTVVVDRELFLKNSGFREDLEICEDYEFWLRLSSQVPVAYIDEALVVKTAGHDDQLSMKYGYIEIFKIKALKSLVDNEFFSGENMRSAKRELARKCRIYSKGCRKRGREKEAAEFESLYFFYGIDDVHKER